MGRGRPRKQAESACPAETISTENNIEREHVIMYSKDNVHDWVKRAMSSIKDVNRAIGLGPRSKEILLADALECLELLDKAFESTESLNNTRFKIIEKA